MFFNQLLAACMTFSAVSVSSDFMPGTRSLCLGRRNVLWACGRKEFCKALWVH